MKTNTIIHGDALTELKKLESESVDCVMTSPPYWALRDYGVEGQLGLEPTFELYVKNLCDVFDEIKRVLKKSGTCWINLGDTYIGSPPGNKFDGQSGKGDGVYSRLIQRNGIGDKNAKVLIDKYSDPKNPASLRSREQVPRQSIQDKSLAMIPFRFAIEMVNRGWVLRNTIIWNKPNVMPSSVKDRFTVDFEYLFFFVKNKKYFFETQYEQIAESSKKDKRIDKGLVRHKSSKQLKQDLVGNPQYTGFNDRYRKSQYSIDGTCINSLGRNKRAVWRITTKPFKEAHFATYPEELCETPIKAGCPEFVCNKCGKAREPIYESKFKQHNIGATSGQYHQVRDFKGDNTVINSTVISGYTSCSCNDGFSGGIVLDPFFGAGTTGLVALKQNKQFIGIELNPEYIKIAEKRLEPYLEQTKLVEVSP